jgi:hypothetical protein
LRCAAHCAKKEKIIPNNFFNPDGSPSTSSFGSSATIRNDFSAIGAGFDKLAPLTGNALKLVRVNAAETSYEPIAATPASLGLNFADAEVATGAINGVGAVGNAVFVLANIPNPAASCYAKHKDGPDFLGGGINFNLVGKTATFVAGSLPQAGDQVFWFYRY